MKKRFTIPARGVRFRRSDASGSAAPGGLTPERIRAWKSLFDPQQVSIKAFLERFKTRTKDLDKKTGAVIFSPFVLFDFQDDMLTKTEWKWSKGRAAKFRIPKSRQLGVSQFWRAFLGFERVLRVPGYETAIIGQDVDASEEHLTYLAEFYNQIPDGVLAALNIKRLRASASSFSFRHGDFRTSRVVVKTARKRGLGRGGQMNGCITTEFPHWPDLSKRDRSGFMESLADVAGNVHADESTVMGLDEFYDDCMDARDGRGSYMLVFIPAHISDRNYRKFTSKVARENFARTLGKDDRYGGLEEFQVQGRVERFRTEERGEEQEVAEQKALEFLNWRRIKIDDDCKRVSVFHREQPTTLDEAFQGSGRQVFDPEVVESWVEATRKREQAAESGALLIKDKILFNPRRDGALRVFERPRPDGLYCFGADPASGHRVIASGGGEADFSVMVVKEAYSGRTVARLREHLFPKHFADLILTVCAWYNGARGFLEVNTPTTVSFMIEEDGDVMGYRGEDVLLTSERKIKTTDGWDRQAQFGWNTSEKTKNYMAGIVNKFLDEIGRNLDDSRASYHDWQTIDEMMRYVYDDRGRMAAERGHDDCVIAEGLALIAREEVLSEAPMSSPVPDSIDPWAEYFELRARAAQGATRQPSHLMVPDPNRPGEMMKMAHPGTRERTNRMPGF